MNPESTLEVIPVAALLERVGQARARGARLVQIGATALPGQYEVTYSFDVDGRLSSLRILLPAEDSRVPSIGSIYTCAFLYENEMHDLFSIKVEGMAVDFHGNLYNTSVKFAFGDTKLPAVKPAPAPKTPPAVNLPPAVAPSA